MTRMSVISRDGIEQMLDSAPGISVMESIREAGIDELLAACGGCCSCATCHVYVDSDHVDALPPMSADEDDLLDGSDHRRSASRLSCQIKVSEELDGLRVIVAPEQ